MLKLNKKVFMLLFATAMVVMPMSVKAADYDAAETETVEENDSLTVDVNGIITNVDALDEIDWDLSKVVGKTAKIQTSDSVEKTSDIEIKSMYNEYKRTNKYVIIHTNHGSLVRCYDSKKKLMWTDDVDSTYTRKECWNTCCYFEFYNYKLEACPEGSATDYKVVFAKPVKKWYVPYALQFTGKAKTDGGWDEKKMVANYAWNPVNGATKYEVYIRPYNKKENAKWYKVGATKKNSIKISKYRNDKLKKFVDYQVKIVTYCGKYKSETNPVKCYIGIDK